MVGSRQANLQTLGLNIFTLCMANQIRLEPEWIPRKENEQADFIRYMGIISRAGGPRIK